LKKRLLRGACAVASTLPALLLSASALAGPLTNPADRAPVTPMEARVFGKAVSDPYQWMEAPSRTADVRAWLQAASDHTAGELSRMPGYGGLLYQLRAGAAATATDRSLATRGTLTFRLRQEPGDALPKLVVRDTSGPDRVLYDPAAPQATGAVNNYSVSPDGRRVAVHTAAKGTEVGMIRVIDTATGQVDPQAAGPVWGQFPAAWLDNETFLYVHAPSDAGSQALASSSLRRRRLGQADDATLLRSGGPEGLSPDELFHVEADNRSPWTLVVASGAQADRRLLVARNVGSEVPQWREAVGYARRVTTGRMLGDDLYVISQSKASNGDVRRINLVTGREDVILPAGETVLQDILPTGQGLYISGLANGVERFFFLPRNSRMVATVALPPGGSVDDLQPTADGRGVTLAHVGWLSNRSYFRVEDGRALRLDYGAATPATLARFEVLQEEAFSRDGARVPLTVLAPRNLPRDGRAVTVLDAYGGYGEPVRPFYRTEFHVWLERGGVFAFCGVRGGGDKGRAWHEAGRAGNKPKAQQDFVACGERLVQLGFTSSPKLIAHGGSNGALVVGPAVLQRPDLFRGAIIRKGMLNATRIAASGNGPNHYAEMGDPAQPAGFAGLYEQDAYLWLDRASAAPDFMLSVGLNDSRVEPWFSAKFAAKALSRFGDRSRVLVTASDSGHFVGDTREQIVREAANVMAFALSVAGDPDFQVGAPATSVARSAGGCGRAAAASAAMNPSATAGPSAPPATPPSIYKRRRC
jgi:prolyl oligopeptidase